MDKKELMSRFLFSPLSPLNYLLKPRGKNRLFVLAYHRVGEWDDNYPFNKTIWSATPDQFDRQLRYLKDNFNVTNFRELHKQLANDKSIKEPTVILTFDDGYNDNHAVVAPMMEAHGLTATFYVATDIVGSDNYFWFDLLHYYIKKLKKGKIQLNEGKFTLDVCDDEEKAFYSLGQYMKTISDDERRVAMVDLEQMAGGAPRSSERPLADVLTWDQIRDLNKRGFEIGSHSRTHPHLSQLTAKSQIDEIFQSKSKIEQEIGHEVVSFSYPTGGFDDRAISCVKNAGYDYAVAYDQAIWNAGGNEYLIPRIHVEPEVQFERFKGALVLPELFLYGL